MRDELMGQGRESNDYTPQAAMNLPNFFRQANVLNQASGDNYTV